jgi:hypothetical protein
VGPIAGLDNNKIYTENWFHDNITYLTESSLSLLLDEAGLPSRRGLAGGDNACISRPFPSFHMWDCMYDKANKSSTLNVYYKI